MSERMSMPLRLAAVAIDCPNPRRLAEFYGSLLGWDIDEAESRDDWVELADPNGGPALAFQRDPEFVPPTWPDRDRPQMQHLDVRVRNLGQANEHALRIGATALPQPPDQLDARFLVYADPAGHPFCLCEA